MNKIIDIQIEMSPKRGANFINWGLRYFSIIPFFLSRHFETFLLLYS